MKKKLYPFQKNISSIISKHNLLQKDNKVIVAVSGGSDSVALLSVLHALPLKLKLIAVYVDHCLRPQETPAEIAQTQTLCATLGIKLVIRTVDVKQLAERSKTSIEEAARSLRYQALAEVKNLHNFDKIAVGHHADDQVEEFFIRLFRGSGSTGLAGMQLQHGDIIRPLLFETKQAIEQYLRDKTIPWSTDSSNCNRDFLRNRIRHDLLPNIEENFNPGIRNTLLHTMNVIREEDDFLNHMSEDTFAQCVEEHYHSDHDHQSLSISLDIDGFLCHHLAIRRRILEKICWKMASRPSFIIIADIDLLAQKGESGKELHLSGGLRVTRQQQTINFNHPPLRGTGRGTKKSSNNYILIVDALGSYHLPEASMTIQLEEEAADVAQPLKQPQLRVDLDKVQFPLTLRGVEPGERFTPYNGAGSKKIARYFNEKKLDKNKRPTWPILLCANSVVAIVGYAIEHGVRVTETTTRILSISYVIDAETTSLY